jgi:hypothetical protein
MVINKAERIVTDRKSLRKQQKMQCEMAALDPRSGKRCVGESWDIQIRSTI